MNNKWKFTCIDDAGKRYALWWKILWLYDLSQAGFPIPENTYFMESISSFSKWDFCDTVWKLHLNFPIILRSSANVEDGVLHSFAGLFNSFVCQNREEVWNGFDILNSYDRENITSAYPEFQENGIQLNAIIQSYIPYEFSWVFITQYTDSEDGYCECVKGDSLAKLLHHGECDYSFRIRDWSTESEPPKKEIILDHYNLVHRVFHDIPYQYEWCISQEKFYFLQKRPYIYTKS